MCLQSLFYARLFFAALTPLLLTVCICVSRVKGIYNLTTEQLLSNSTKPAWSTLTHHLIRVRHRAANKQGNNMIFI